jgi:hypothetical protein
MLNYRLSVLGQLQAHSKSLAEKRERVKSASGSTAHKLHAEIAEVLPQPHNIKQTRAWGQTKMPPCSGSAVPPILTRAQDEKVEVQKKEKFETVTKTAREELNRFEVHIRVPMVMDIAAAYPLK